MRARTRQRLGDVADAVDPTIAADLAQRAAEAQAQAIVTAGEQTAAGLTATAASIQKKITGQIAAAAIVGGGIWFVAKKKGWI